MRPEEVVLDHEAVQGVPCTIMALEPSGGLHALLQSVMEALDDVVRHLTFPGPQTGLPDVFAVAHAYLVPKVLADALLVDTTPVGNDESGRPKAYLTFGTIEETLGVRCRSTRRKHAHDDEACFIVDAVPEVVPSALDLDQRFVAMPGADSIGNESLDQRLDHRHVLLHPVPDGDPAYPDAVGAPDMSTDLS